MVELMTDIRALEKSLNEFVHEQSNRSKQMETLLLEAHSSAGTTEERKEVLQLLMDFYSFEGQPWRAESFVLESEEISDALVGKYATASFYVWAMKDYRKALKKLGQLNLLDLSSEPQLQFDALSLKGLSCVQLGRQEDAKKIIEEQT